MFGENLPGFLPVLFWGIITISTLVFIHEAGHYLAARILGLKVTEFFIGLPGPSISFKRGDTRFGITAIPLGGYVRIPALEGSGPGAELGTMTEEERKEYEKVPAWKRVTVLLAGVVANLVVAIVILTALFTYTGIPIDRVSPVPGGPAATAGLPDDSRIVDIDGRRIHHFGQLTRVVAGHEPGDTVNIIYISSEGERNSISVVLEQRPALEDMVDQDGQPLFEEGQEVPVDESRAPSAHMGVIHHDIVHEPTGVAGAFTYSFTYILLTAEGISRFFSPHTFTEAIGDASSVVGISVFAAHTAQAGFITYISFIAMISIALGLMNLLPIPPLDGGKVLFEIIQKVTGKPVPQGLQVGISLTGFALLIVLMIYLVGQDLFRIFG
ncbi:MAG: RIP metalloprotease [Coriobacteriia bacterium]|nr:RIP metalloprotease [Coriobacteriia bacterium]MCL2870117.1 RIP metalloprotease [Coriobacteriia bacterium]